MLFTLEPYPKSYASELHRDAIAVDHTGITDLIGNPEMPAYCAAKGAVVNLTRQLAVDWGAKGLRVNALCPGPTLSPRFKSYLERGLTSRAALERQVMLHRLADCREIANVAAFLVSDAASFVHGGTVVADGGQTIH